MIWGMRFKHILVCLALFCLCQELVAQDDYSNGTALLGIRIRPVPLDVLETVGLNPGQGTMVTRVWPGTAADNMGLRPGDVIINVNGTDINSRRDVRTTVIDHNAGDEAKVVILRNGVEPTTLHGTYSEMPDWLEERFVPRVPHMTERWEDIVADRQREILAERQTVLDEMEAKVSALETQQGSSNNTQAAQTNQSLLPPISFPATNTQFFSKNINALNAAWYFVYSWEHTSEHTGAASCSESSSLVHF